MERPWKTHSPSIPWALASPPLRFLLELGWTGRGTGTGAGQVAATCCRKVTMAPAPGPVMPELLCPAVAPLSEGHFYHHHQPKISPPVAVHPFTETIERPRVPLQKVPIKGAGKRTTKARVGQWAPLPPQQAPSQLGGHTAPSTPGGAHPPRLRGTPALCPRGRQKARRVSHTALTPGYRKNIPHREQL